MFKELYVLRLHLFYTCHKHITYSIVDHYAWQFKIQVFIHGLLEMYIYIRVHLYYQILQLVGGDSNKTLTYSCYVKDNLFIRFVHLITNLETEMFSKITAQPGTSGCLKNNLHTVNLS